MDTNSVSEQISKDVSSKGNDQEKGFKGDYASISLLLFLYVLEGLPIGILTAIPMIMASNNVSYNKQAIFTFATYPYAMKLLWAPIVDSVYSKRFGRRKSWVVPVQYLIGITMILTSLYSDRLIGSKKIPPNIYLLTANVFFLVFLTATQDVAIDAWALTLLSKRNVHHASSCNAVGCLFGMFLSNTVLLALESADFCNKWFRKVPQPKGIITVGDFLLGAGLLFMATTTLICALKREKDTVDEEDNPVKGVLNTYKMLGKLLQLRSIRYMTLVMFTQQISHSVVENVTDLKLIQFGVKRENISLIKVPVSVFHLFLPFFIVGKAKNNPLTVYWNANLVRLLAGCLMVGMVYWTQVMNVSNGQFPVHYYLILLAVFTIYDVIRAAMGMTMWSFKTKIADPKIGATYITLLTTLHNIGARWTNTVSVWVVDLLTITIKSGSKLFNATDSRSHDNDSMINNSTHTSITPVNNELKIDGYYTEFAVCFILGLIWLKVFRRLIMKMQAFPESEWRYCKQVITKF